MSATDFSATSDARLKNVVSSIEDAIGSVKKLNGVKYYWTAEAQSDGVGDDTLQVGLLAQDVQQVLPEVVISVDGRLQVIYDKVIPLLVEAIKELSAKVDALESRD